VAQGSGIFLSAQTKKDARADKRNAAGAQTKKMIPLRWHF